MCERDYDSRCNYHLLEKAGVLYCESCGESTDDGRLTPEQFKPLFLEDGAGPYVKILCCDCQDYEEGAGVCAKK